MYAAGGGGGRGGEDTADADERAVRVINTPPIGWSFTPADTPVVPVCKGGLDPAADGFHPRRPGIGTVFWRIRFRPSAGLSQVD